MLVGEGRVSFRDVRAGDVTVAGCDLMLWQNCGQRSHLALMSYLDPPRYDPISKIKKPALRKVVLTFLSG